MPPTPNDKKPEQNEGGGNVKNLVRTATSGRKIIVIDGCPLACSKACLSNHSVKPDINIDLSSMGVSKKLHEDFDMDNANQILKRIEMYIHKTTVNHSCEI